MRSDPCNDWYLILDQMVFASPYGVIVLLSSDNKMDNGQMLLQATHKYHSFTINGQISMVSKHD